MKVKVVVAELPSSLTADPALTVIVGLAECEAERQYGSSRSGSEPVGVQRRYGHCGAVVVLDRAGRRRRSQRRPTGWPRQADREALVGLHRRVAGNADGDRLRCLPG